MAPIKTIPTAFVVFLCVCSQALSAKDFDYYSLVLMWPPSYCYQTKAGCCLPTTGKPAKDFFITGLHTHESTTGAAVTKCKKSNFDISELSDLTGQLNAYWNTIKCPSGKGHNYWKNAWKTYGVCSGLSQHDYFKTALELRSMLNLLSILTSNGIVPSGENFYKVEYIKKVIEENLGVTVGIQCSKNLWDEWQLYQLHICFNKEASKIISCPQLKKYTCGDEVTFGLFTYEMLSPTSETIRMYTSEGASN